MSLPLNQQQTQKASKWLLDNFGEQINEQLVNTPYRKEIVLAMICKETASEWLAWIDNYSPAFILQHCVFDPSGEPEFAENKRSAFPKDRNAFVAKYSPDLLTMLVNESNEMRRLKGWSKKPFLYKGYGIFQYDLQNIITDYSFFADKKWYYFSECMQRYIKIMNAKAHNSSIESIMIAAYNGNPVNAVPRQYAKDVLKLAEWV